MASNYVGIPYRTSIDAIYWDLWLLNDFCLLCFVFAVAGMLRGFLLCA